MSNNLQQLHHSFNFYFFTANNRHISSGLYLYPVFAMQLPLLSFLIASPAYQDIRSMLVGLGTIAVAMASSGGPIFVLATNNRLARRLDDLLPGVAFGLGPPACKHEAAEVADKGRLAAAAWLAVSTVSAMLVALVLRQYAFKVFNEAEVDSSDRGDSVTLGAPLWEVVCAASGFAYLIVLAPITIYAWALAVPLTVVCVPALVLARPASLTKRPLRSLLLITFLVCNAFLLAVPPARRTEILGDIPGKAGEWMHQKYRQSLVPLVPPEARPYLAPQLVHWLHEGSLAATLSGDLLLSLYEAARDFNCVGGMLFPVFCFAYWPFLVLVFSVGFVFPAQRVDDKGMTLAKFRILALSLLSILLAAFVGGVFWRSMSSSGLGTLQW